jgi:Skp family chaperone for outer membrane proteins
MNALAQELRNRLGNQPPEPSEDDTAAELKSDRLDNQPPEPIEDDTAAELKRRLESRYSKLLERVAAQELGISESPEVVTDENREQIQDFIRQGLDLVNKVRQAHRSEKQPFLDHGRVVDSVLKHCADRLSQKLQRIQDKISAFARAKQALKRRAQDEQRLRAVEAHRKADEEAARLRAEAAALAAKNRLEASKLLREAERADEAAAAAQKIIAAPPIREIIHSDLGTTGYLREMGWTYEIENPMEIPWQRIMTEIIPGMVDELLDAAVKAATARGIYEIPGLRIFERDAKWVTRR